jgi:hypothetical protein
MIVGVVLIEILNFKVFTSKLSKIQVKFTIVKKSLNKIQKKLELCEIQKKNSIYIKLIF